MKDQYIIYLMALMLTPVVVRLLRNQKPTKRTSKFAKRVTITAPITVHDGDTLYCEIPQYSVFGNHRVGIRVYGCDTKELGQGGEKARDWVKSHLENKKVEVEYLKVDKYGGRIVAKVWVNGKDLAVTLIKKGLAKPYYGGKK